MTTSIFAWQLGTFLVLISSNSNLALTWSRATYLGSTFIPITTYHFVTAFIQKIGKRKKLIILNYLIGSFIFIPLSRTRYFLSGAHLYPWGYWFKASTFHPFFLFFVVLLLSASLLTLISSYKREKVAIERVRKRYILLAVSIGLIGGVDYIPNYGVKIYPFGYLAIIISASIIAYAVIRYRLLDVNIVLTRAGIFIVVYTLVLGIPFIIGYNLRSFLGLWYIPLFAGMLLASTGPFIYTVIRRRAENRLRREEFLAHQALNKLAQDMMRVTKLDTLLKLIVHHVVKIMKVSFASIYLRDEGNKHYLLRAAWGPDNPPPPQSEFLEDTSLVKDILLRRVTIVSEELSFGRTSKVSSHLKRLQLELHKAKAAVVIPAFKGDYLFGFLILGARRDNRLFTQDDLNLLMLLANQSVLAIENAQLFEKEKNLLAEKSRRDALADMAPGVAHQFNNRLAAIIASVDAQMALNELEDITKLSPEKLISLIKDSQNTLNIIEKEALRGKDIANAILKKGKAKLAYIKTDLVPIIQSAIDLLRVSRTRTSLEGTPEPEIILDVEENLPQLILNESLAQDIFYNLIDNARDAIIIKYKSIKEDKLIPDETPFKGRIAISIRKKGDEAVVTVQDNGIGMDEKTKARLFVPYFTTKATSLKGTGMGLWVIRSFIEDHKGRISFESEYAKGTTFTITFPIKEV